MGRAHEIVDRIKIALPEAPVHTGVADAAEFDVVINATSLGLRDGDPSPIAIETLQPGALVCEVVMRETDTALLAGARQRACILHEGIHMLHGQLEERSEEHTSELQSLMRISYAVFCLKKKQ